MVIHGIHSIRPILIFKLHRVIIPSLGINVKLFLHFNSLLCPKRHGISVYWRLFWWAWAVKSGLQVEKKMSESGGGELWENFCGRVSITTPSPDLITI